MYKIIFTFIITICFSFSLLAQVNTDKPSTLEEDINNPDEAGIPMPNVGILLEEPIIEVVEGVGHVPYNRIPFRTEPKITAKVLRYSAGAEKVLLIGEVDDWYKVIMYDNREAYIQKKYVRAVKLFVDETATDSRINKTFSFELADLLHKFDTALANSNYAKKNQARPIFELIEANNVKDKITLLFHYAYADLNNKPIPSYSNNNLYEYMQQFLDLILGKLILTDAESFNIIINIPTFNDNGTVINFNKEYAKILIKPENIDIDKIRKDNISILSLAESSVPIKDLFKIFPK